MPVLWRAIFMSAHTWRTAWTDNQRELSRVPTHLRFSISIREHRCFHPQKIMNAIHRLPLGISLMTFIFKNFQLHSSIVCYSYACAVQQGYHRRVTEPRFVVMKEKNNRIAMYWGFMWEDVAWIWEVTLANEESWTPRRVALRISIISSPTSHFQHLGQRRARFTVRGKKG